MTEKMDFNNTTTIAPFPEVRFTTREDFAHFDMIINSFSIKQTILDVLNEKHYGTTEELAEKIADAFAVKMGLKQGKDGK